MLESARDGSRPYTQSKTAITNNTLFFNTLTKNQGLPARPRDFKRSLAVEENNIGNSELSDVLSTLVRRHILERSISNFSFPRGRPKSDADHYDERRGQTFSYDNSMIKQIIDEVLKDPESSSKIDKAVTNSAIFYSYRKYSFKAGLHQLKENEQGFLNSFKPAITKYGIKEMREPNESYIKRKDITDEMINKTSEALARNTRLTEDEKNILYTTGGILFFDHILRKHQHQAIS